MNEINNNIKNNNKYKKARRPKIILGLLMMIIGLGIYIFSMYVGITGKFSFMHIRLGRNMNITPIWNITSIFSLGLFAFGLKKVMHEKYHIYLALAFLIAGIFTMVVAGLYYFN